MNLILLTADDYTSQNEVRLTDRRFSHIRLIHKAEVSQSLKVGLINGNRGTATVISIDNDSVVLCVLLNLPPLTPLPLTLLLALPRPKMLKRILQSVASLGIKDIYLINSFQVEKSFWSSPVLEQKSITENLQLGLEQAGDTIMPVVHSKKRFKPFVEDELAQISQSSQKWVAHPYKAQSTSNTANAPDNKQVTLAIGPEGGFIEYEIDKLNALGFTSFSLGSRILRVETAIPFAVAKLFDQ